MPIPASTQALLNLISPDSFVNRIQTTWHNALYVRWIQQPVGAFLNNGDFQETEGLTRARQIATYIDQWRDGQQDDREITGLLNNFNHIKSNVIPGEYSANFTRYPIMEQIAKSAYQRAVLLEAVRGAREITNAVAETEENRQERQALLTWAQDKERTLATVSFYDKYMARAMLIKQTVVSTFPEQAFTWLYRSMPHYLLLQLNYLIQLARSFPNPNRGLIGNIWDLLWGIPAVLTIPFFTVVGISLFLTHMIFHPITFIINPMERLLSYLTGNNQLFKYFFNVVKSVAALIVPYVIYTIATSLPYVGTVFMFSLIGYAASALLVGPLLMGASWALNRLGYQNHLHDDQFPQFCWRQLFGISLTSLLPIFSYASTQSFFQQARVFGTAVGTYLLAIKN